MPLSHLVGAYCTANHRLTIELASRWSTIPISRYKKLTHFCSYNVIEVKTQLIITLFKSMTFHSDQIECDEYSQTTVNPTKHCYGTE